MVLDFMSFQVEGNISRKICVFGQKKGEDSYSNWKLKYSFGNKEQKGVV